MIVTGRFLPEFVPLAVSRLRYTDSPLYVRRICQGEYGLVEGYYEIMNFSEERPQQWPE